MPVPVPVLSWQRTKQCTTTDMAERAWQSHPTHPVSLQTHPSGRHQYTVFRGIAQRLTTIR